MTQNSDKNESLFSPPEKPRVKNFVGMFILIVALTAYAFLIAGIADFLQDLPLWVQMLYFAVAGIIWIFPAHKLMKWMAPKPPTDT